MLSTHAHQRMQQRAIPMASIELLLAFGESEFHRCREVVFFGKQAWQRVTDKLCAVPDRFRNHYLVLQGGEVVTVGHRLKHFKRCRR
ncbi:DUF4258 domain-containing protein [Ferrimonas balearica]|uniref:DUF4258 domain-containing protein n=1 Tax=Ferrimonas balearica TaxID=44012 RepID=UPI001F3FD5A1|nr:DUF4258 domain-containing protein [Ferrimonas balearica]MBY6093948.1 DUF4258 domain-containing protein [Ferrimonas balearica]